MAPALFDGLYNLAAPLEGGAGLSAEMALDKHELECLAVQEVPGRSRRLKEMIDLVRSVEENETKMFKMHLDEQQTRLPAQAVLELGMVIRDTEKLVDKKKAAFAKVAHVWAHRKKMEDERGWNASFEQAADNQYINLELCRARLRALEKLAQLYRRLSRPQRASSQTLFVPGSVPVGRHKSAVPDESDVEDDPPESASRRSNTPIPHDLDHAALALAAYTPGARSDVNQAPPGQPRRASEAVRRPSIASSSPHSPSPPSNFALAAAVAASSSHTSPSHRPCPPAATEPPHGAVLPQAALATLTELYHLAPTFVPAHEPSTLSSHITSTLATPNAASSRPKPHDLRDLVLAQTLLDVQRVKLDAGGSTHTGILGIDVKLPSNAAMSYGHLGEDDQFDHRASFYSAYAKGAEPPLAQRLRKVVDALHGTQAGGRAGPATLREQGAKAVQWNEGLERARRAAQEQERRMDEEAQAFADVFEEDERRA